MKANNELIRTAMLNHTAFIGGMLEDYKQEMGRTTINAEYVCEILSELMNNTNRVIETITILSEGRDGK